MLLNNPWVPKEVKRKFYKNTELEKMKIQLSKCVQCMSLVLRGKFIELDGFLFFDCILGLGVHVKNMQDCCIGTHMAV